MLVIRLSALGDVAMTIPVIYSVARQYPELRIDVVTRPFFARLFINSPANVHVVAADLAGRHKGVIGTMRLLGELARLRPGCVADLHNVLRSWIIDAWFLARGVRVAMVDKTRAARRHLFSDKVPQRNYCDRYADVFARLGYPVELTFRSLFEQVPASPPFEPQHPAVGIAPFARYYNKTYPPEMIRAVARKLAAQGVNVYLFGSRGQEANDLHAWANDNRRIHSVAGKFSIEDELALMNRLDAMVSMDSANQHMASLAGTPVVSVWGSTTPACGFMAYRQNPANAVCLGLECQPCSVAGKPTCPREHFECMHGISPDMIVSRVLDVITVKPDNTTEL